MRATLPVVVSAVSLAFACGVTASRFFVGEARAQTNALAATLYVPSDGLVFRTFEGRVIAKLSYDGRGGALELYDEHERPGTTIRSDDRQWQAKAVGGGTSVGVPGGLGRGGNEERPDLGF